MQGTFELDTKLGRWVDLDMLYLRFNGLECSARASVLHLLLFFRRIADADRSFTVTHLPSDRSYSDLPYLGIDWSSHTYISTARHVMAGILVD